MRLPALSAPSTAMSDKLKRLARDAAREFNHPTRSLLPRDSSSSSGSSSSSTCGSGSGGGACTTPASLATTQNIAIVLGTVIPLVCAAIVLFFLHRRHLKKQRQEDLNDPHKSLDFGMEGVDSIGQKRGKKTKGPEMSITEAQGAVSSKHANGLSLDMGLGMSNPYLLPGGLNDSRESLHSMSRNMHDEHDPYRPVTMMRPSMDNDSSRFGRLNDDKGSLYSTSTDKHSAVHDRAGLVANARPMSESNEDKLLDSFPSAKSATEVVSKKQPDISVQEIPSIQMNGVDHDLSDVDDRENFPLPSTQLQLPAQQQPSLPTRTSSNSIPPPPVRKDSISTLDAARPESSNYGDDEPPAPSAHSIAINEPESQSYDIDPSMIYTGHAANNIMPRASQTQASEPFPPLNASNPVSSESRLSVFPGQNRLSVMGMRPLPPELPDDNPEIRANRIRSFYKEYFDDSKPNPAQGQYDGNEYGEFFDGVVFDPDTGGFYAPGSKPFAQGPGRRAMTPPPRARPRVSGNSSGGPHGRKLSTYSMGRPRGRSVPKKKLPPPKALTSLPTPHLMKDDSGIFNALDFAPPSTFRNEQNGGRPDSPMGVSRPYSPNVKAYNPLVSSFDNLAVLPSPHDLRRSGTFTALDFAPPSKLRDPALSPSDAGSIRSNRSGISAMHNSAVRDGAYRVSRIPKEMVTTKEDLSKQLRPKLDMISRA